METNTNDLKCLSQDIGKMDLDDITVSGRLTPYQHSVNYAPRSLPPTRQSMWYSPEVCKKRGKKRSYGGITKMDTYNDCGGVTSNDSYRHLVEIYGGNGQNYQPMWMYVYRATSELMEMMINCNDNLAEPSLILFHHYKSMNGYSYLVVVEEDRDDVTIGIINGKLEAIDDTGLKYVGCISLDCQIVDDLCYVL